MTTALPASSASPAPLASAIFAADEPVLQSHPLTAGVPVPVFGDTSRWPMIATPRAANMAAAAWVVPLPNHDPVWNLRGREVAMAMLNPQHPAVLERGINVARRPYSPLTVYAQISTLRLLATWAQSQGMSSDISGWELSRIRAFLTFRRGQVEASALVLDVRHLRRLVTLHGLLTGGGLPADPWPGQTVNEVAEYTPEGLTTKNIRPEVWFALVRASWAYIHDFAPDILAARENYRLLVEAAQPSARGIDERLRRYLADPDNRIPVHTAATARRAGQPNLRQLALTLGVTAAHANRLLSHREKLEEAVAQGRGIPGGLQGTLCQVTRADGSRGPWVEGFDATALAAELTALRGACFTFIAALSMMRDSEIRAITRNSVVEYYGTPAVVSRLQKLNPSVPKERWWIIEPVAETIRVAEKLSQHPDLIFATGVGGGKILATEHGDAFDSGEVVKNFVAYVNTRSASHGLHIPPGSASPHQFRKTMSMLTSTEPGWEIALGTQLHHAAKRTLSNRLTEGYAAPDADWAKLLDTALEDVHFERLSAFYDEYKQGRPIGFGPGAERVTAAFRAVEEAAEQMRSTGNARQGDGRVEYDLLRKTRIPIRFGKLNHCTVDDRDPAGAVCRENAKIPVGHTGPLHDMCRPGRCGNAIVTLHHIGIWSAEKGSVERQMASPKIHPDRRASLQLQLDEVNAVIAKVTQ
ncbi:integrase [Kitasatospora sp. NPDC091335]|uniref:integrase n=1 Tax=Kitasatospora sp. NPDC091335 TaxID=3364085 RepID=UPI003825719D